MLKYILLVIGGCVLLVDLYFAFISFGFRKTNCGKCKAFLKKTVQKKGFYVGRLAGRYYKNYLLYVYVYQVNGKEYRLSGGVPGTKGELKPVETVIYQRNCPKYAYLSQINFPIQPVVSLLLCPFWIVMICCAIFLV